MSRSSTPTRAWWWAARENARFTWRTRSLRVGSHRRDTERTNQRRCSCPRRLYRWQRRRPFSRSECRVWAEGRAAALPGVHLAWEDPARGSELVHVGWRKCVLRYERIVMAQSAQGVEEPHSRDHHGRVRVVPGARCEVSVLSSFAHIDCAVTAALAQCMSCVLRSTLLD
jgi:hypothetical protein